MRAKELVPILSDRFAIEPETGAVIDRSLATEKLRQQGKGRSWPEMTREEAIIFLLACLAAEKPTKAAQEVAPWLEARARVGQEPLRLEETEAGRTKLALAREWGDKPRPHEDRLEVKFWRLLDTFLVGRRDANGMMGLVDYLAGICDMFEAKMLNLDLVSLDLVGSLGRATVTFTDKTGSVLRCDTFDVPAAKSIKKPSSKAAIRRTASVNGRALREIVLRTRIHSVQAETHK